MSIGSRRKTRHVLSPKASAPAPAVAGGYQELVFEDDFLSLSSIDMMNSCLPGFKWYLNNAYGHADMPPEALSVQQSVLTIHQTTGSASTFGIYTATERGKTGNNWQYGYFEARMAFDPSYSLTSDGWPSFWGISYDGVIGGIGTGAELDIFEAYHAPATDFEKAFIGTLHYWQDSTNSYSSRPNNYYMLPTIDFAQFHTYACLWEPGRCRWYFDDQLMIQQAYSSTGLPVPNPSNHPVGTFSCMDNGPLQFILGTGYDYLLQVDWVRIWQ